MNLDQDLVLAYLEEDNVQRAYFRVRPLITCHGDIREEAVSLWPDEGCLRIVPDRAEQHTFKDRMRALGHYCAVDLRGVPADAGKIRTNKNYRPERGEINQFILYSDTVKPLPEHTFFEVLPGTAEEAAALADKAVTPLFYIRMDDTLLGPVQKQHPVPPQPAGEAAGTLVPMESPDGVQRVMLCMPSPESTAAPVQTGKPASSAPASKQAPAAPVPKPAAPAAPAPKPAAPVAEDAPLPLGQRLTILEEGKSFDETLQELEQPLSKSANLLHTPETPQSRPSPAPSAPLSGTPLYRAPLKTSVPQPKNKLQEVVSSQWRVARYEPPADSLPAGTAMRHVVNPVETACQSLRVAWAVPEAQTQLTDFILSLDGMRAKLEPKLSLTGGDTPLQRVMLSRLQDLEAERLAALIQLDQARADVEAFRKNTVSAMQEKSLAACRQLDEKKAAAGEALAALQAQLNALTAQRDALQARVDELQQTVLPAAVAKAMADAQLTAPVAGIPLRMSSVPGVSVPGEALLDRVCSAMQASGAPMDRTEVAAMLALLAVSPRIGLVCAAPAVAATVMRNVAAALGWLSGYAQQISAEQRPLPCAPTPDGTPAVLLTALPNYAPLPAVTKVMVARSAAHLTRNAAYDVDPWPVFSIKADKTVAELPASEAQPVSAASLRALSETSDVTSAQIDQALAPLAGQLPPLSGSARSELQQFIAVCAGLLGGNLPAAIDWAILLWFMPALERNASTLATLKPLLQEYPRSLAQL
ncbi:MAG: hypothetical protein ACI4ML_05565 [Aristaeellaceae bacterium]